MALLKQAPTVILILLILSVFPVEEGRLWSNGGYSSNPAQPDYGTHDWLAQHALDWLPEAEKSYITSNLNLYLYGTELPDNGGAPDGIGDTSRHHVYYRSDRSLQDDSSAERASEEYEGAVAYLEAGDLSLATKYAGVMTHYIADLAVFGHVMGAKTDWGAEAHHSDYEDWVGARTGSYGAPQFVGVLRFDGRLDNLTAYDGALRLAYDTTFGGGGGKGVIWMDTHYNQSDSSFLERAGESLSLAVNILADVLHTLYLEAHPGGGRVEVSPPQPSLEYNAPQILMPAIALLGAIAVAVLIIRRMR